MILIKYHMPFLPYISVLEYSVTILRSLKMAEVECHEIVARNEDGFFRCTIPKSCLDSMTWPILPTVKGTTTSSVLMSLLTLY